MGQYMLSYRAKSFRFFPIAHFSGSIYPRVIRMKIDYNEFYRQATTRICSTLNLDTALKNTFEFIRDYIPVQQMQLAFFDPGLKLIHIVSSVTSGNAKGDYDSTVSFPLPEEVKNKWLSPSQKRVEIVNQPAS